MWFIKMVFPLLPTLLLISVTATAQPIAFIKVAVIDVAEGEARPGMTVVVTGDRITGVGRTDSLEVPANATIIDAAGKYLIPGLWDMHVHVFNQVSRRPPHLWYFPLFIANGVTGVREMWTKSDDFPTVADWREQLADGTLLAPRIAAAGMLVDGPGSLWPTSDRVDSAEEGRALVHEIHEADLNFVKTYDMLPREAYFAIMDEARRLDIPVAGHIPTLVRTDEALAAGHRSAEHLVQIRESCSSVEDEILRERARLYSRPFTIAEGDSLWERHERLKTQSFDRQRCVALARRLADGSMWQVPTLVNERRWYFGNTPQYQRDPRLFYVPAGERRVWEEGFGDYGVESEDMASMTYSGQPEDLAERWAVVLRVVEILGDQDVPILAGTDLGGPYIYPGFSLHDELALLVEAGLTPLKALQAATLGPARFLGRTDDFGTVEEGKVADLVLLDANPLEDIANTQWINAVVLNGRLLDRVALDAMLAEVERTMRE